MNLARVVNGPFDVLRPPVVSFDLACDFLEPRQLPVAHAGGTAKFVCGFHFLDSATFGGHMPDMLVRDFPNRDFVGDFRDHEPVGRDFATDNGRPQTPRRFNRDHGAVTGERAAGEHHTRAAGFDHLLNNDRDCHPSFWCLASETISERGDGIETGPTGPYLLHYLL